METKNFIFGYGSLISKESRKRTGISGKSYTTKLNGFKREWNVKISEEKTTALGIIKNPKYSCNGVIFEVPEKSIKKFDKREEKYYSRIQLNPNSLNIKQSLNMSNTKIWVYTTNTPSKPTKDFPILLSYIDVILSGCLKINENFAKKFIETTSGWKYIKNDRNNPIYPRPEINAPKKEIDELLEKLLNNRSPIK